MAKQVTENRGERSYLFIAKGKFFETAKALLDGFVEHNYEFAGETKTSFRRYYDNVSGKLTQVGLYKDRFNTKNWNLVLVVEDEDETNQITIPWKTSKGSINLYARNLVARLENVSFDGNPITLAPFEFKSTEDDGSEKLRIGVGITDVTGEKLKAAFYEGIPKPTITKDDVGEDVKVYTDQNKFYYGKLLAIIEKFKASGQGPVVREKAETTSTATAPAAATATANVVKEEPKETPKAAEKPATEKKAAKEPAAAAAASNADPIDPEEFNDDLPF